MGNDRILFVDDEKNILDGFKRQLRGKFNFDCAVGPEEGLASLMSNSNYAVIVSDMRMPVMDGLQFLTKSKSYSPNAVHIMLTGNADQETAIRAINEGAIFRFLSKPCTPEALENVLKQAISQFKLIIAEKELLQKTLSGSIKLLTDVLALIDPEAMTRSTRAREFVKNIAPILEDLPTWELELALALGNIGSALLPDELIKKMRGGLSLQEHELALVKKIPETGSALVRNIPRLEGVAEIILYQQKNYDGTGFPLNSTSGDKIHKGARLARIINAASASSSGLTLKSFQELRSSSQYFDVNLLDKIIKHLSKNQAPASESASGYQIKVNQLIVGQVVVKDILLSDGRLLMKSGSEIREATIQKIKNYAALYGVQEPVHVDVLIPTMEAQGA